MTRAKISEYSATANDNTDVNGVNIAEGCPPSSMNNMGREIMAALKRFQVGSDGDGVTVGGQLAVTGTTTTSPAIVAAGDTNTGIFFPAADTIAFAEGGAEAMRIDSSGNVGIGTASGLDAKLNVVRNTNGSIGTAANAVANFQGAASPYNLYVSFDTSVASIWHNSAGRGLAFGTGDTERMRIDSSGNVGIGTTSPGAKLQVQDSANRTEATAQFRIGGSGYSLHQWLDATAAYIGQDSASRALRIYSSAETAGVNLAAGGTSWGTFSDERLKYDVEPITDGLTKLSNVRCVSYRLKDVDAEDSQKKLGVIAQDLVGVVDEVIDTTKRSGDDTEYMSVRYTELIPVLTKAIQELKAELDTVKAELAILKG